jgi:small subunit ribosomal protein S16
MAVCIRLARYGSKKVPYYRVVVTDRRNPRDGRFIENIGTFDPSSSEVALKIDRQRLDYWQGQGAQPSHTLTKLLKKSPAPIATES